MGSILNADTKMSIETAERIAKRQQNILCQCKTYKIQIPKEKRQNENT
jgi:hypothetical protein